MNTRICIPYLHEQDSAEGVSPVVMKLAMVHTGGVVVGFVYCIEDVRDPGVKYIWPDTWMLISVIKVHSR